MGPEVGRFIRRTARGHDVTFHLERTVSRIDGRQVTLSDGVSWMRISWSWASACDRVGLAEQAGLAIDRGITVNEYLETSAPEYSLQVMSHAGPIRTRAIAFASSTGWSPSVRDKWRQRIS